MTLRILFLVAACAAATAPEADAQAPDGKMTFMRRCSTCHSLDRNEKGPALAALLGRRAGTAPGFKYSPALNAADFAWDEARLDRWMEDPSAVIPGVRMKAHTRKPEERRAIIGYLQANPPKK